MAKSKRPTRAQRNAAKRKALYPYKSHLEAKFAALIRKAGLAADYEPDRLEFITKSHYVPDWKIAENTYIETKGYLSSSNRSRLIDFKKQYPHITVCLVFQASQNKIYKNSKTTYAQWAERHGFEWSDIKDGVKPEWWDLDFHKNKKM